MADSRRSAAMVADLRQTGGFCGRGKKLKAALKRGSLDLRVDLRVRAKG